MRIIELEFENINSYEGKVHIDFTDKKFAEYNDQFVICGETASGKSTILDAITLALYGRTARMSAVVSAKRDGLNKSEVYNELINKRSGHCMAAVTYLCSKGKIRSEYRQKKAYSKRDGNLQPATFSVKNLDTQISLLTDKATVGALEEQTEKLIGLNYEQFISCVLIPQGEFDRFLSADDGQKAGILAKLSHTEKYKKAAVKLIAKQEEVEKEFQIANNALARIPVLSLDELTAKINVKEELDDAIIELQKKINVLVGKISDKRAFNEADKKVIEAQRAVKV